MIGVPVSTIISFLAVTAIYHLISKGLGGSGTYNQMIYACGAFYTPVYLLSTLLVAIFFLSTLSVVLGPSGLISGVQNSLVNGVTLGLAMLLCCVTPFGIALGIFAVFQSVFAISAVEKTTSGKAFLSWLITTVALILLNQAMQEVWKVIGSVLSRGS